MKKLNITQIVFLAFSLTVMVCIFLFSSENSDESSNTSSIFVNVVTNAFYKDFNKMPSYQQTEIHGQIAHIIRKMAHFSIYMALGFFLSLSAGKRKLLSLKSAVVVVICFLYACSDELHQYFVPGRACMFTDVLIDTCGGITGLLISAIIIKIITKNAVPE